MTALIDHLEKRLGRMLGASRIFEAGETPGPVVAIFRGGNISGVDSFATVGASSSPLISRKTSRRLHLEFMMCGYQQEEGYGPLPNILKYVAGQVLESGQAVLRGDVMPLPVPIFPGGKMTALYAAIPVYFDPDFASVVIENSVDVGVVWLIPVGKSEVSFIEGNGWQAFEDELVARDPDLLDARRAEMGL